MEKVTDTQSSGFMCICVEFVVDLFMGFKSIHPFLSPDFVFVSASLVLRVSYLSTFSAFSYFFIFLDRVSYIPGWL